MELMFELMPFCFSFILISFVRLLWSIYLTLTLRLFMVVLISTLLEVRLEQLKLV